MAIESRNVLNKLQHGGYSVVRDYLCYKHSRKSKGTLSFITMHSDWANLDYLSLWK